MAGNWRRQGIKGVNRSVGLLLHPGDLPLYYGLFALLCVVVIVLVNVMASRANKVGRGLKASAVSRDAVRRRRAGVSYAENHKITTLLMSCYRNN